MHFGSREPGGEGGIVEECGVPSLCPLNPWGFWDQGVLTLELNWRAEGGNCDTGRCREAIPGVPGLFRELSVDSLE